MHKDKKKQIIQYSNNGNAKNCKVFFYSTDRYADMQALSINVL